MNRNDCGTIIMSLLIHGHWLILVAATDCVRQKVVVSGLQDPCMIFEH